MLRADRRVPLSERLLRMAEQDGDEGSRLQAHHSGWTTWFHAGDPAKTREHADAGRLPNGAWAESLLGYPDKALASIAKGLALAERLAHPFTLGHALVHSSQVYLHRREPERALRQLARRRRAPSLRSGEACVPSARLWRTRSRCLRPTQWRLGRIVARISRQGARQHR